MVLVTRETPRVTNAQPRFTGDRRVWRAARGLLLDVGPFLAALGCATGRQALAFGKSERAIFDAVVDEVGVPAVEVAMVAADLRGAIRSGLVVDSVG